MPQRRFQFRPALGPSLALLLAACGQQGAPLAAHAPRPVSILGDLGSIRTYFGVAFSDVALDAGGNAVVVGAAKPDSGFGNLTVSKYDPNGSPLWSQNLPDPAKGNIAFASELALDAGGNVYAIGNATFEALMGGGVLVKYDADGNFLWKVALSQNFGDEAPIAQLAVDPAGAAYINGQTEDQNGFNAYLEKHNADGTLAWHKYIPAAELGDLAADAGGNLYSAYGGVSLRKWSPQGYVRGTKTWEGSGVIRVASRFGSVYTLYSKANGETRLNKYDANSLWQWSRVVSGGAVDLSIDSRGNLYILGNNAADDVYVDKYEPERGARQWTKTFDDGDMRPTGVGVDAAGNVVVVGGLSYPTMDPDPTHQNVSYIARMRP